MKDQLMTWALRGAELRLQEMDRERSEILATFPSLGKPERRHSTIAAKPETSDDKPRKGRTWSAAERKAVSKQMKAYWRKRRAER